MKTLKLPYYYGSDNTCKTSEKSLRAWAINRVRIGYFRPCLTLLNNISPSLSHLLVRRPSSSVACSACRSIYLSRRRAQPTISPNICLLQTWKYHLIRGKSFGSRDYYVSTVLNLNMRKFPFPKVDCATRNSGISWERRSGGQSAGTYWIV